MIRGRLDAPPRRVEQLDPDEAMRLLGSIGYGRVVFTLDALPAIRPVNHVLDDGDVVIRTRQLAGVYTALDSNVELGLPDLVVAYEADDLDPVTRLGWSVVVTGLAAPVTDPVRLRRTEARLVTWVDAVMDRTIAIRPALVTGMRLVAS